MQCGRKYKYRIVVTNSDADAVQIRANVVDLPDCVAIAYSGAAFQPVRACRSC